MDGALPRHLRGVSEASADVVPHQAWITREELVVGAPLPKEIDDHRHPEPVASDARLPETNVGVDSDSKIWMKVSPKLTT